MEGAAMTKLVFLATEDWFVGSHFLPLVRRARDEGYDVAVAAQLSGALSDAGVRLIDMPFARGSLGAGAIAREIGGVRTLLRTESPDIVHTIALKPIVLSLLAGASGAGRAFALTGRGYLGARGAWWMRLALAALARRLRSAVARGGAMLLVENEADRRWAEGGVPLPNERVALMPGAGVDIDAFAPASEPGGPIVIGVASRLIWSKGVDLAVAAVSRLRAEGFDIELRIAGGADQANRESVRDEELARWRSAPGVTLLGRVDDINAFWAGVHIACLPSRGGEGLPRTLLEAAACGRPLVTTDTPGCVDFVRGRACGLVAPPNDVAALAAALQTLAGDANARRTMGVAARAQVIAGYTEAHAADCAAAAWRRLLAESSNR
jgi:glycosyltransferase involved in cell wall biosynthesis